MTWVDGAKRTEETLGWIVMLAEAACIDGLVIIRPGLE